MFYFFLCDLIKQSLKVNMQTTPSSTSFRSSGLLAGNLHSAHMVRSVGVMWQPMAMR